MRPSEICISIPLINTNSYFVLLEIAHIMFFLSEEQAN
jgi:hypothetical protein